MKPNPFRKNLKSANVKSRSLSYYKNSLNQNQKRLTSANISNQSTSPKAIHGNSHISSFPAGMFPENNIQTLSGPIIYNNNYSMPIQPISNEYNPL